MTTDWVFACILVVTLTACCVADRIGTNKDEAGVFERTARAICQVESSGGKDKRDGDNGKAIGPFQIHRGYWEDATYFLQVDWPYSDARDMSKARAVVHAYTRHYARRYKLPWTPETIARIHNGGPRGWSKNATLPYWSKVQRAMQEQSK